jgi:hypothetical protein
VMAGQKLTLATALRAAFLIAVTTTTAARGQGDEPFVMWGKGRDSCGQYLQAIDAEENARPPNPDPLETDGLQHCNLRLRGNTDPLSNRAAPNSIAAAIAVVPLVIPA